MLRAAVFDVDGVLLDSFGPHLQFCKDRGAEYGISISVQNADEWRRIVSSGVKISPMRYFLLAVGFPDDRVLDVILEEYERAFVQDYPSRSFPGIEEMLSRLSVVGLKLGIVTSNVRANIESALGPNMRFFQPECVFTKDDTINRTKAEAIRMAAERFGFTTPEVTYIGDQPSDWQAAKEAGVNFLGVAYGWGIYANDDRFSVVENVMAIADHILDLAG